MKPAIDAQQVPLAIRPRLPEPFATQLGSYQGRSLGDYFGLTQLGVRLETLQPECQSALRHWHTRSEECVYILHGEATLVTDAGESILQPGMCVGFQAGVENAHHLVNKSDNMVTFLAIGTRAQDDQVHYPDDDFQWIIDENGDWCAAAKNGKKY